MSELGKWRKDAWDRDLGPCETCGAELRRPCVSVDGRTRSAHEGRTTDPAFVVLHTEVAPRDSTTSSGAGT